MYNCELALDQPRLWTRHALQKRKQVPRAVHQQMCRWRCTMCPLAHHITTTNLKNSGGCFYSAMQSAISRWQSFARDMDLLATSIIQHRDERELKTKKKTLAHLSTTGLCS